MVRCIVNAAYMNAASRELVVVLLNLLGRGGKARRAGGPERGSRGAAGEIATERVGDQRVDIYPAPGERSVAPPGCTMKFAWDVIRGGVNNDDLRVDM